MTEDPAVSMWAFMVSWFTPTFFFLFLNLTIGTIVLSSRFTARKNPTQQPGDNPPRRLVRIPALLGRKSFDFSLYRSESSDPQTLQHHQLERVPSLLEGDKSFNFSSHRVDHSEQVTTLPESEESHETHNYPNVSSGPLLGNYTDTQATRTESGDSLPKIRKTVSEKIETGGEAPAILKKSSSDKLAWWRAEEEEAIERRRPATVRKEKKKGGGKVSETASSGDDEGVDADNQATRTESGDSPPKIRKTVSEKIETGGKAPAILKKSASEKLALWRVEEEEAIERQRPATVREEKKKGGGKVSETASSGDDEGVDAKADDFIIRFKQQLKLQRLDSLRRFNFKEILNRGSGK